MLILHDPATLLHETVELLGSKLIPALESPERIKAILKTLTEETNAETHQLRHLAYQNLSNDERSALDALILASHDRGYVEHLRTAHENWVARGLIEDDESVLPECFLVPTRVGAMEKLKPPKDVFARPGYYAFDMSSGIARDTWIATCASANLAVEAVNYLTSSVSASTSSSSSFSSAGGAAAAASLSSLSLDASTNGEKKVHSILALCRPPGHHCNTRMAGGYCYVNNAVVAVSALRQRTSTSPSASASASPKIAIIDVDFHHGNGTQDAFYSDPSVLYVSIHGQDEYPYYSGFEGERGEADGKGFNFNYPLPTGSSFEQYLGELGKALTEVDMFMPDYVLVSLGFDTFHLDPIGNFKIATEDYETMARTIKSSKGVRGVKSAILLEGGYVIDRLGANLLSFLKGWEGAEQESKR